MSNLTIVANIIAKPIHTDTVKKELLKLVPITREENGCIQYDLHQDHNTPNHFVFYENWESHELWQEHMNNDHIKEYITATNGMVDVFTVNEMYGL